MTSASGSCGRVAPVPKLISEGGKAARIATSLRDTLGESIVGGVFDFMMGDIADFEHQ